MIQALNKEQFEKLVEDIPEDGFRTLLPLIMESFAKKKGRMLDRVQIAALATALMEMGATIDGQVTYIGELQKELEAARKVKEELWTPPK